MAYEELLYALIFPVIYGFAFAAVWALLSLVACPAASPAPSSMRRQERSTC